MEETKVPIQGLEKGHSSAWWAAHVFSWDPSRGECSVGANRKQTLEMTPSWLLKAICPKPSSLQELCSRRGPWTLRLWLLQNWKVLLMQCTYSQYLLQKSVLIPNEQLAASSNSTILGCTPRYIKHSKVTLAICMYLMGLLKTLKWHVQLTSDTCSFLLTWEAYNELSNFYMQCLTKLPGTPEEETKWEAAKLGNT